MQRTILTLVVLRLAFVGSLCLGAYVPVETGRPTGLPNDEDYQKGLLNVRKFTDSNGDQAQGDGSTDDTVPLQEALVAGRDYNLTCYFPSGTYLISDTLYGMMINFGSGNGGADREHPTCMIGQKGATKPVIKGKAGNFNNKKPLVWLWGQGNGVINEPSTDPNLEQPNASYNHVFRGIDLDIGSNYNGVGIHFKGAQGCTLEDVRIWSSTNASFYAGMEGGIAIGGGIFNLRVEGGKYGLWGSSGSKFTILAGAEFIGQSIAAIEWNVSDTLVVTGVMIEKDNGPAIKLPTGSTNMLHIVDGVIDITSGSNQIAIENVNDKRCSMLNVFVRGAKTLVKEKNNFRWNVADDSKWALIEEYSYANNNKTRNMINGGALNANEYRTKSENVAAPDFAAMKSKHVWDSNSFPSIDDPDLVNVKDFGVLGNNNANDANALQAVIDNNPGKTIFLPRGDYRVGKPITLGFNTKLLGVGKAFARIHPTGAWENSGVAIGTPIVKTVNNANANTILSDIYIGCNYRKPRFTFLRWQAGKKSIVRDVLVALSSQDAFKPPVQRNNIKGVEISENGGGRWYALALAHLMAVSGHAKFRLLSVTGTTQPLSFYGLNVEHCERPTEFKVELNGVSNIQMFQFKAEVKTFGDNVVPLAMIDCDNTFIIGSHAILNLPSERGFIEVTDCENYLIQHVNSTSSVADIYLIKEDYFGASRNIPEVHIAGLVKRGSPVPFDHFSGGGSPPVLAAIADQSVDEGGVLSVHLSSTDSENDPILLAATGVPNFGTLSDNGDGTGSLLFTPGFPSSGAYIITVEASDGNSTVYETFTLTVNAAPSVAYYNNFSSGVPVDDFTGDTDDFYIAGDKMFNLDCDVWRSVSLNETDFPSTTASFKIVTRMKSGAGDNWEGAAVRFRDIDSANWYELQIQSDSGNDLRLYGKESGSPVTSGQWNVNLDPKAFRDYSIVVSGSTASVYLDNDYVGSATIANTSGTVGLRQRKDDAWWEYFRVVSPGLPDYEENFDTSSAEGWSFNSNHFEFLDIGAGNVVLKQVAGSWSFATYNEVISVDANFRLSVDARVTGTRTNSFDSSALVLKYQDADNWISLYIFENTNTGVKELRLKKKIGGIGDEVTVVAGISSLATVSDWHNIEAQVSGSQLSVWINSNQEIGSYIDSDLNALVFDASTLCGVRSQTAGIGVEFDNFSFFDEYNE